MVDLADSNPIKLERIDYTDRVLDALKNWNRDPQLIDLEKFNKYKELILSRIYDKKILYTIQIEKITIDTNSQGEKEEEFILSLECNDIYLNFIEDVFFSTECTSLHYDSNELCEIWGKRPLKLKELFYSAKEELSTKDNEFEKRFLSIERDLVRNHNFSSVKNELGKIIHDAKIKNLSEVVDRARELMRLCNNKEREFSKKVNSKNSEEQDEYFDSVKKESDLVAKFPSSGRIIHNQLGPIRTLTKPEIEARGRFLDSQEYVKLPINNRKINVEESFPELHQTIIEEEQIRKIILDLNTKFESLKISEIFEKSQIKDERFIIKTIEKMIRNKEITAQYLLPTKTVVFNQLSNIPLKGSLEKKSIPSEVQSDINWEKPHRVCNECGKRISSEFQVICEGCGIILKKNSN